MSNLPPKEFEFIIVDDGQWYEVSVKRSPIATYDNHDQTHVMPPSCMMIPEGMNVEQVTNFLISCSIAERELSHSKKLSFSGEVADDAASQLDDEDDDDRQDRRD